MIWNFVKQKAQSFLEQSVEAVSKPIIGWFKKNYVDEEPCHDMVCYTQEVIDLHFRIAYSEYLYARITGSDRGEILKLRKTVEQFCNDEEFLRTGQVNQEAFIEFMISPQGEELREIRHSAEKRNLLNSRLMDTALQYYDGYAVRPLILNPSPQGEGFDHPASDEALQRGEFRAYEIATEIRKISSSYATKGEQLKRIDLLHHPPQKNQRKFFKKMAFWNRGFLHLKIINHVNHCFI